MDETLTTPNDPFLVPEPPRASVLFYVLAAILGALTLAVLVWLFLMWMENGLRLHG